MNPDMAPPLPLDDPVERYAADLAAALRGPAGARERLVAEVRALGVPGREPVWIMPLSGTSRPLLRRAPGGGPRDHAGSLRPPGRSRPAGHGPGEASPRAPPSTRASSSST
ncbi:hypothetical protein CLM82_00960 [Streptomyces albidoflavus]|nr:hypothetical protein CLM82_00960 [Streptomyces albidoflavus]